MRGAHEQKGKGRAGPAAARLPGGIPAVWRPAGIWQPAAGTGRRLLPRGYHKTVVFAGLPGTV